MKKAFNTNSYSVKMKNLENISIRAAYPTFEEGLLFARYLNEAAEGFFSLMLGGDADSIIAEAYTRPGSNYSYQNVFFAEHEKRIAGMVLGFTAEQHGRFSDRPLNEAARGYAAVRMKAVKILCAPLMRILSTIPDGDFYILALAVDKEFRGKGIGSTLMDSIEDRAVTGGSARLALDVSSRNVSARRLYERRGMRVESQWPKRPVIPGIRILRMTKMLPKTVKIT